MDLEHMQGHEMARRRAGRGQRAAGKEPQAPQGKLGAGRDRSPRDADGRFHVSNIRDQSAHPHEERSGAKCGESGAPRQGRRRVLKETSVSIPGEGRRARSQEPRHKDR